MSEDLNKYSALSDKDRAMMESNPHEKTAAVATGYEEYESNRQ